MRFLTLTTTSPTPFARDYPAKRFLDGGRSKMGPIYTLDDPDAPDNVEEFLLEACERRGVFVGYYTADGKDPENSPALRFASDGKRYESIEANAEGEAVIPVFVLANGVFTPKPALQRLHQFSRTHDDALRIIGLPPITVEASKQMAMGELVHVEAQMPLPLRSRR